jgi:hypothetical protein
MSLDLYVMSLKKPVKHTGTGIFIRTNGQTKELSLEEAKKLYPNANIMEVTSEDHIYWHGNITHNLGTIANHCLCQCPDKTSLYSILWRPEETTLLTVTGRLTSSYIKALSICLRELKDYRNYYEKFNPENGWGNYDDLVNFVESLLVALNKIPKEEYNNYTVEASR